MKKAFYALGFLAGTTALVGGFTFMTVRDYLVWRPAAIADYRFDKVQKESAKPIARVMAEEVSKIVLRKSISPVTGSVIMDETMSAYRDVRKEYGEGPAVAMATDIMALWDQEGIEAFKSTLSADLGAIRDKFVGEPIYTERMEKAKAAHDFIREIPERPVGPDYWAPFLGAVDPDEAGGSMPFSRENIKMPDVPPPFEHGSLEDQLDIELVVAATRIAGFDQKVNSVFWQGSDTFTKGLNATGINPGDAWQTILFKEGMKSMTLDEYIDASAGLAAVVRDASIATWKIKYRDWVLRPSMRVPKLEASIGNPSFPSYISGHATMAAAAAEYLKSINPENAKLYMKLARDAEKSRFFGGVHSVSDNYVGKWVGQAMAAQHLGRSIPEQPPVFPHPKALRIALDVVEAGLDATDRSLAYLSKLTSKDGLSFYPADMEPPAPRSRAAAMDGNDTMKGAIAAADLNGDGLPELLMSGYKSVRLYENAGKLSFDLVQEIETPEINGAYFTQDVNGEVDGFWEFGVEVPRWHARTGEMSFDQVGITPSGFPTDGAMNFKGMILEDINGDGIQDAIFLNYDEIKMVDGYVSYAGGGLWSHQVVRDGDSFDYLGRYGDERTRVFAGGFVDIDGDGDKEEVVVNDGKPVTIRGTELERGDRVHASVAGMSFTPVRVKGREAVHVSNIYDGKSDLYVEKQNPNERDRDIDGDILISVGDDGRLVDVSHGTLQTHNHEWSWGSAAGDINGDGLEDLVIVYGFTPNLVFDCGVRIMLQNQDGTFTESDTKIPMGNFWPKSVVLRDMDDDGDLDIVMSSWNKVQVWENTSGLKPKADFSKGRPSVSGFLSQDIR